MSPSNASFAVEVQFFRAGISAVSRCRTDFRKGSKALVGRLSPLRPDLGHQRT